MDTWAVQDAKARFSEFLDRCLAEGPQLVTRRGQEAAVLVPHEQWQRMQAHAPLTVKEWLLAPEPRVQLELPRRGRAKSRPLPSF